MKFLTAYLQAQHADENPDLDARYPPRPSFIPETDIHFLGGSAYVWFSGRITRSSCIEGPERRLEFLQALSGLKKRQPEIPWYKLAKSTKDWTQKIFSSAPVEPPELYKEELYDALDAVVQEIVYRLRPSLRRTEVPLPMPSTKARMGYGRKQGGAFGWMEERLTSLVNPDSDPTPREDDRVDPNSTDTALMDLRLGDRACVPVWGLTFKRGDLACAAVQTYYPLGSLSILAEKTGHLDVSPRALPEPFKVRMISVGPAESSFNRQMIQKVLHRSLQRLPEFHLTHERDDRRIAEIVTSAFGQEPLALDEGYVSGDYTASTDNLSSHVSNMIGRRLSQAMGLDPKMEDAFIRSLTGHRYSTLDEDDQGALRTARLEQSSGQLMGSETSFPVLCIANLALSILALRLSHYNSGWDSWSGPVDPRHPIGPFGERPWWTLPLRRRLRLRWSPGSSGLVINGDDFGARMTHFQYATWRKVMPWFGLSPSVGKNFFSREFLQINSRMLVPRPVQAIDSLFDEILALGVEDRRILDRMDPGLVGSLRRWEMVLVPSHSLQVLAPPRPVSFAEACLSLPEWQETFLDVAKGPRRDQLNTLFLRHWREVLDRLPSDLMNWFVPRDLGGFGLETTRPLEMSVRHRHIAAYLRDNTSPEGWRDAKLKWADVQASTTLYRDQTSFLRRLEAEGLVKWGAVGEGSTQESLDVSVLNDVLAWSGYSRGMGDGRSTPLQAYVRPYGTYGELVAGPARARPPEPDTLSWFSRSVARLKKAASSTARTMTESQVSQYRARKWAWLVPEGLTVQTAGRWST
jgi:hypothetical protein